MTWADAIAAAVIPGGIPAVAAYEAVTAPSKTDWNTIALVVGAGAAAAVAILAVAAAASKR